MNELIEIKAKAYDAMLQIEAWQKILRELNAQIAEMTKKEVNN